MFPFQCLKDCIVLDCLSSKNLEVVSDCNSGLNIIMVQCLYHLNLAPVLFNMLPFMSIP